MKNYAKYYGALGSIFLVFGAIGSLMLGGSLQYFGIIQFILGLIGVAIFGFYYIGETLKTISQKRDVVYGIIGGGILLLVLIGANVIAHTKLGEKKFDTTANKLHSLAAESANLVKNLTTNIQVVGFLNKGAQQRPFLEDLAKKYTYETSKIKFEFVDPDQEPATLKNFEAAPDEVIVRNEETKKSMKLTTITEEALTSAIKKVMSAKAKVAYFLQGHGEGDLEDDKTSQGLFVAKLLLENEGFSVKPLNLATKGEIPNDANIIAIWSAQRAFSKSEVDLLIRYFERGGNIVIGQDPLFATAKDKIIPSGLEPLLEKVGLEFKPSVLLEYQLQLLRGNVINAKLAVADFGKNEITNSFGSQAVVEVFLAQPVVQKADFKNPNVTRTILASTSTKSWAESDIGSIFVSQKPEPKGDQMGPLPIAQSAELTISEQVKDAISKKGKIVVFGDSDLANNQMVQGGFNRDLFLNSFNYSTGEEMSISIRPKTWTSSTLEINDSQRMVVYFASIFFIPELIMGLGVVIWLFRRSRA